MGTDFFERQEIANRKAARLFWLYLPAICLFLVIGAASVASLVTLGCWSLYIKTSVSGGGVHWWYALWIGCVAAVFTLGFLLFEIYAKWRSLNRGIETVAVRLGGSEVSRRSTDPIHRRVTNVVEEMAIASGVPPPSVYVLEEERGINAFVIGFSINNAVLGVTRGSLELLTRDELQAVIAHEFSHILNGDMQFNARMIAMLHGVIRIKLWGEECYAQRNTDDGDDLVATVAGSLLVTVGSVGVFFSRILKSAICRQREYIADAAAVQFTRNPAALVSALKKIGGLADGSRVRSPRVEEASHLFFGEGRGKKTLAILATHPRLEDRIRCFEPGFDGRFQEITAAYPTSWEQVTRRNPQIAALEERLRTASHERGELVASAALVPAVVSQQIGTLSPEYLNLAAAMLAALPLSLRDASGTCVGAEAVVLGLLVVEGGGEREAKIRLIENIVGEPVASHARTIMEELVGLQVELRLPLVETAIPALRHLTSSEFRDFKQAMKSLVEADRKVTLFELVLQRLVVHQLERQFAHERQRHADYFSIRSVQKQFAILLSLVAHSGNREASSAIAAFERGAGLVRSPRVVLQLTQRKHCSLKDVDRALATLATASLPVKKQVITACAACVVADGEVTVREAILFRLISECLDCPIPPVLL
jgi:Zn-dependent protease with chaperone function